MRAEMNTGQLARSGRASAKPRYAAYAVRTTLRSVAVTSELNARTARRFAMPFAAPRGTRQLAIDVKAMPLAACPWRGVVKGYAVWSCDRERCGFKAEKARLMVRQLDP